VQDAVNPAHDPAHFQMACRSTAFNLNALKYSNTHNLIANGPRKVLPHCKFEFNLCVAFHSAQVP
jgi:hypothetical protein